MDGSRENWRLSITYTQTANNEPPNWTLAQFFSFLMLTGCGLLLLLHMHTTSVDDRQTKREEKKIYVRRQSIGTMQYVCNLLWLSIVHMFRLSEWSEWRMHFAHTRRYIEKSIMLASFPITNRQLNICAYCSICLVWMHEYYYYNILIYIV